MIHTIGFQASTISPFYFVLGRKRCGRNGNQPAASAAWCAAAEGKRSSANGHSRRLQKGRMMNFELCAPWGSNGGKTVGVVISDESLL